LRGWGHGRGGRICYEDHDDEGAGYIIDTKEPWKDFDGKCGIISSKRGRVKHKADEPVRLS
jgi:hypothetical protein